MPQTPVEDLRETRSRKTLTHDLGPLVELLEAPDVVEILANGDGILWADTHSQGLIRVGEFSAAEIERLLSTIAGQRGLVVGEDAPVLETRLPFWGSRVEGVVAPVVERAAISLRKPASLIYTFEDYVAAGILLSEQRETLEAAIRNRRNIMVSGGPGSGKTTFANALLDHLAKSEPEQRVVILEDTPELQCAVTNRLTLRATEQADLRRLVRATLRLRPDRVIVGEVRGPEALDLLKVWNTGVPGGVATIHANAASAVPSRLRDLIEEAGVIAGTHLIEDTVDVVVHLERRDGRRRVSEIAAR
jgi:type IV secretion system protein VirB11